MDPRSPAAARLLLVVLAAGLAAVGAVRLAGDRACTEAGRDAFAVGVGRAPASRAPAAAAAVRDACAGTPVLAASSAAFLRAGAIGPADRMAALAVSDAPEDHRAWTARAAVLAARGDTRGAARARARARALNPLAPRPRAAGRPAQAP